LPEVVSPGVFSRLNRSQPVDSFCRGSAFPFVAPCCFCIPIGDQHSSRSPQGYVPTSHSEPQQRLRQNILYPSAGARARRIKGKVRQRTLLNLDRPSHLDLAQRASPVHAHCGLAPGSVGAAAARAVRCRSSATRGGSWHDRWHGVCLKRRDSGGVEPCTCAEPAGARGSTWRSAGHSASAPGMGTRHGHPAWGTQPGGPEKLIH
jgi:hypothetical protein